MTLTKRRGRPPKAKPAEVHAEPVNHRLPIRYCARFQGPVRIEEIHIGTDLQQAIAAAERHHAKHGYQTWVWNVRTGETLYRVGEGRR